MEHFNGGGHANVAGAQLAGKKKEEFFEELKQLISSLHDSGDI